MKLLKPGLLALFAAAALFAIVATSASAVELGEWTVETNSKIPKQTDTTTFEMPSAFEGKVTGTELEAEIQAESKKNFTTHWMYFNMNCVNPILGTAPAETLGDSTGIFLVLGQFHITGRDPHGGFYDWWLVNGLHYECLYPGGGDLLTLTGNLIVLITPAGTKTKSFKLEVEGSKGKQDVTEFENDLGEKVKASLVTELNESGKPAATDENDSKEISLEDEKETELV